MGLPMARNLLRAHHRVTVYNRTQARCELLRQEGAGVADSVQAVSREAEVLITMLADDSAMKQVVLGEEQEAGSILPPLLEVLELGAFHIAMGTISVALSKRLTQEHQKRGQGFLAAPVFGRPEAAEAAKLWIVAGGASELVDRARPLFDSIGQGVFVTGEEPASANVVKLGGNFLIASMLEALGEAFALVRKAGVDSGKFLEMINGALFKSPLYANYGGIVTQERFDPPGFKLRLGLKDARLVLQAADLLEAPMPLASLIHDHLLSAVARGHGEKDWAALASVSAENAGLGSDRPTS
jgi:3-hydroxyisobutyrate dehydrogenase-like beta-hydroxyacid dehydrogenase